MIWLTALPASAAPLCRDTKGLFTPCPRAPNAHARAIIEKASVHPEKTEAAEAANAEAEAAPAARETPRKAKPPLFNKTKLCRDTKGLFTPCPR